MVTLDTSRFDVQGIGIIDNAISITFSGVTGSSSGTGNGSGAADGISSTTTTTSTTY